MVGQAFSLANNAYVSATALPFTINSSFTVEAWINPTSLAANPVVFEKGAAVANRFGLQVTSNGRLGGYIDANSFTIQSPPGTIPTNAFTHVAFVFDDAADQSRLFVNGVLAATSGVPTSISGNSSGVTIGKSLTSGFADFFDGRIDEVSLYNRALSDSEIQAIVNAGSAGKCKPPQPTAAFSRKVHGVAGPFDIDLMPLSKAGVDCRSGGASGIYQMIVQFSSPVTVTSASLISGNGSVSGFSTNGATVTVDLMNITNAQTIFMKLMGVSDGVLSGDVPIAMGVLLGDTTGNGIVSASDVSQAKSQSGQPISVSNFRNDVTANGVISASDVSSVKVSSGTALP